jgi:hypothetical protein
MKNILRWIMVLPAAHVGFLAAMGAAIPLNWMIHSILWSGGHTMPGKMFLLYTMPYDGALAAVFFILFGSYVAPNHRNLVALLLLIWGGILGWLLVGEFYSPQFSPNGPIRVWWPIIGTYLGGLATFGWICLTSHLHVPPGSTSSPRPA